MTVTLPNRLVVLLTSKGDILTHFTTNRDEFAAVATHDRDRIFSLVFQGDLATLEGLELPTGIVIHGAMYKEVDAWRINGRTINKPRPMKRRIKSALIIPFRRKVEQ